MRLVPEELEADLAAERIRSLRGQALVCVGEFDRVGVFTVNDTGVHLAHDLRIQPGQGRNAWRQWAEALATSLSTYRSGSCAVGDWDVIHLTRWHHVWVSSAHAPFRCWDRSGVAVSVGAAAMTARNKIIPLERIARIEAFRSRMGSRHGVRLVTHDNDITVIAQRREWVTWMAPTYGTSMEAEAEMAWAERLALDLASHLPNTPTPRSRMAPCGSTHRRSC